MGFFTYIQIGLAVVRGLKKIKTDLAHDDVTPEGLGGIAEGILDAVEPVFGSDQIGEARGYVSPVIELFRELMTLDEDVD